MPRAPPKPSQGPGALQATVRARSLPPCPQCLRRLLGTSQEPRAFSAPLYLQNPEMCVFPRSSCTPTPSARDFAPRRLDSQDGFFFGGGVLVETRSAVSPPPSPPSGSLSFCLPLIWELEVGIPEWGAFLPFLRCLHSPHSQCCLNWGNSSDLLYP